MNRLPTLVCVLALLLWAAVATFLLFFRPDLSIALNNWVFQRETMQGHTFLTHDNGPEGFVAFGNETMIYCGRPCTIEEIGPNGQTNLVMCDSMLAGGRKHVCSARFWPMRSYLVQARTPRSRDRR
ncbi:MAG: hypothetical protein ACRD7E_15990 [Bryobacteraceae bacterium]